MDEKPMEEEMMMEEEVDELQEKLDNGAFKVCCCVCECTEPRLKDLTCCCFFPIRCGVLFIGAFVIAVTLFVFLEIFYQLLNDDIHWWYVFVGVILASILIIASAFAIVWFTKDTESSRTKFFTACPFVIIGVSLVAVWATIYFVFLYKKDNVVAGNDGVGFLKTTRKQQVVITLYIAACIDASFAYFICVVSQYNDALKEPEEEMMMEDDKKSGMSKKSGMMMDGEMMADAEM